MEKTKELNLQEIFYAMLNRIWLIVASAVILGVVVYLFSSNFITPRYRASVTMYVNNTIASDTSEISSSDLATAQRLVDTYVAILQQYSVMEKVADRVEEQTGKRPSPTSLMNSMTAEAIEETEVFTITVSHTNAKMAMEIANAIADVSPGVIESIVVGSSAKIVDRARLPQSPYTPNNTRNGIYGAVVGAILAIAYVVFWVMTDVRINGEEDLSMISTAPILGLIPNFDTDEKSGYSYSRRNYAYAAYKREERK